MIVGLDSPTTGTAAPRPVSAASLDRVFKALAGQTRREMLDALRDGPKTTGELVMLFPDLSRFAVMQHLRVLARAKLVVTRKRGRERHNFLNVVPLQQVYERWVSRYEAIWAGTLTDLKRRVEVDTARRGGDHPAPLGDLSGQSRGAQHAPPHTRRSEGLP